MLWSLLLVEHFLGETPRHLILGDISSYISSSVRVKTGRRSSTRDKHRQTEKEMEMIRLEFSKALQDIIMLGFYSLLFLELFCAQSKVDGWPLSPAQGCWNLEQFSASLDVYLHLSSAFPERGRDCGFLSTSFVPGMVPNI